MRSPPNVDIVLLKPMDSESPIPVRIQNVSKRFGETVALDGCSLELARGEVHAIVGENGSGKSTLAKIISGVLRPDAGNISIFGESPRNPMHARDLGVAMIFQEVLVAETLSVTDNVFAGTDTLFKSAQPRAERRRQCEELLERFSGVRVNPDGPVHRLPLSMKQWIVIARALLSKPRVLILDESSAALDLDATTRLHAEIRKLREEGCCVVIVTHRIAELVRIADRATILRDGRVVDELSGKSITEQNLLNSMSAKDVIVHRGKGQAEAPPSEQRLGDVVLSAKSLVMEPTASAFDFDLHAGEIVGAAGLDGQGHADFIRLVAGLTPPISGTIARLERAGMAPISLSPDDPSIAYVSGDRAAEGIFPNLSILENFAISLYRRSFGEYGWIKTRPMRRAFEIEARRLSIKTGSPSNLITSLSGGNQQKILIGRALAANPKIIVFNDPARGVDVSTKRELHAQLKQFADEGGAVIYLSSEIEDFFGLADRVLVFRSQTLFRTISAARFSEHSFLAAMFGEAEDATLSFETEVGA